MSCFGMQAWGFHMGVRESLDIRVHAGVRLLF
jgi:hypothetical protein